MFDAEALGRVVSLVVVSLGPHGARLAPELGRSDQTLLLPRREVPDDAVAGRCLDVFVYRDSDDRPVATLLEPKLKLGEVAFLEVIDATEFGAFCDWGLAKHLLVPRAEQTTALAVGDRHPIGLYVDDTGRLAGTMRVSERLRGAHHYRQGDWAHGEAWRREPELGTFVILERRHVGLLPVSERNELRRGAAARFRIANVLPDGKVELSLRDLAHREANADAEKVLSILRTGPRAEVGDRLLPEQIFALFGLSKKAFKRAVGVLFRQGRVDLDAEGVVTPRDGSI